MKSIFFTGILLFLSINVNAQKVNNIYAIYKYNNYGLHKVYDVDLFIRGNESLSTIKELSNSDSTSFDDETGDILFSKSFNDSLGTQFYKDVNKDSLIFRESISKNGKLTACIVERNLPEMEWKLLNEAKKIGNFNCRLALLNFRGRHYNVWYSTDIPVIHGPWKFYGLPGLLVKISSNDGNIDFTLEQIKSIPLDDILQPSEGIKISYKEYVEKRESTIQDLTKFLQSKLPRGAVVNIKKTKDHSLETEFN